MRVNGEHRKRGSLEGLWVFVGRFLKQHAKACLEVDGQAGGVLAAHVETVGELQSSWLHEHGVGGGAENIVGHELEANESI